MTELPVVQQMLPAHAAGCPAWDYWPCNCGAQPASLVRLTDAESALKARDAEIERLRGDAERYEWLREQCIKRDGLTIAKCGGWNGLEPWSGDDPDAAIDQDRATGGEKANG